MLNDYNKSLHKLGLYFGENPAFGRDITSNIIWCVFTSSRKLKIVSSLFITKSLFDDVIPLMNEIL